MKEKPKEEQVILVDPEDREIGLMGKMEAHQKGLLHRAFSIFIFNHNGELLLQKRAANKYHSSGLWTNTCCSHPRDGETLIEAGSRRLAEEMGMECVLSTQFSFIYKAELDYGLIEHELDHVLFGSSNQEPSPNPSEVSDWRYISPTELTAELTKSPEKYTSWLRICYPSVLDHLGAMTMNQPS